METYKSLRRLYLYNKLGDVDYIFSKMISSLPFYKSSSFAIAKRLWWKLYKPYSMSGLYRWSI